MRIHRFGRKIVAFAGGLLLVVTNPQLALAQDRPKGEVAAGYAYLHETDLSVPAGWFASGGGAVNDWLDVVGAVSGHYKTQTDLGFDISIRLYTFVGGPKFTLRKNPNVTPYVQMLFGGAHVSASVREAGSTVDAFSESRNGFDFQPGGGVDINITQAVGIRLGVNGDFIHSEGETSKEFQFIAGVVIRL